MTDNNPYRAPIPRKRSPITLKNVLRGAVKALILAGVILPVALVSMTLWVVWAAYMYIASGYAL